MWDARPTEDLLGRIFYHRNHIRYWVEKSKAGPLPRREAECLTGWKWSYFALMQALMKRGAEVPGWMLESDGPFR